MKNGSLLQADVIKLPCKGHNPCALENIFSKSFFFCSNASIEEQFLNGSSMATLRTFIFKSVDANKESLFLSMWFYGCARQ